jgi:hypothetical protein
MMSCVSVYEYTYLHLAAHREDFELTLGKNKSSCDFSTVSSGNAVSSRLVTPKKLPASAMPDAERTPKVILLGEVPSARIMSLADNGGGGCWRSKRGIGSGLPVVLTISSGCMGVSSSSVDGEVHNTIDILEER